MKSVRLFFVLSFVLLLFAGCSASENEMREKVISATGGGRVVFSTRGTSGYHFVCKENTVIFVRTHNDSLYSEVVGEVIILDPSDIVCTTKQ